MTQRVTVILDGQRVPVDLIEYRYSSGKTYALVSFNGHIRYAGAGTVQYLSRRTW